MVGHGPRKIDIAWMIFIHRYFQNLTDHYSVPGMPHFVRAAEVCDQQRRAAA